MVCVVSARTALLPLVLLSLAQQFAEGHSWIDCIDTNRTKIYDESASYIFGGAEGNGFCEGYAAGYQGRGRNTIGTEYTYKILKNEVEAGAPLCEDVGPIPYKDWCTRVAVPPEVDIYFAYLPNGHIVKDKKAVGTQHGIYWTGQVGTSLTSTHDMIPENLVTGKTVDFDDSNCGETVDINGNPSGRAGDGKPCIGSFAIPKGSPPGIYKMVWYWEFWLDNPDAYKDPNLAKGYFGAAYSSCFEVEVISGGGGNGSMTLNAKTPVGKPGSPDALMAPQPVVAAEANQPTPPPPSTATPDLTLQQLAVASASMGKDAEDAPTNTPPHTEAATPVSTTPVPEPTLIKSLNFTIPAPEPAPMGTPVAATPTSTIPAPGPAPTDTPPAAKPGFVIPAPGLAPTDTSEAAKTASANPAPGTALINTLNFTIPALGPAPIDTPLAAKPGSVILVPGPAPTDTPPAAKPGSVIPAPGLAPTDTFEAVRPASTTPAPGPAPTDTSVAAKPGSVSPAPGAQAPVS